MAKQPVRVYIFNQSYSLLTESDPGEVQALAQEIDELMSSISSRTGSGDSTRVAVLTCLHLADKLQAMEKQLQKFEDKSERIAALLEATLDLR
jgi:cell division protein ZapA